MQREALGVAVEELAAVQGMLKGTSREVFRHHLETHVADAIAADHAHEIVNELMETLKYDNRYGVDRLTRS